MTADSATEELKHDAWVGTTYGSGWMHRWLVRVLKVFDMRMLYLFAFIFVVPPAMIVNKAERRAIYSFYRRRFGYGAIRSCWMTYRNHCAFSQVVIDRFAMYAGKRFRMDVEGHDLFMKLSEQPSGFIQLSSHIGNYEIAGYSLVADKKRFNALVFGGEKESVMANRNRMFRDKNIRMIPVSSDMSHLFVVDKALVDGEVLSMPADRIFGSPKSFPIEFFGDTARFPQGAFMLAAMREVPALFVSVMKTGAKAYGITIRKIEPRVEGSVRTRALDMARQYAAMLEATVRQHPEQWYNFFDFWAH